jgi:cholesterol oxidase
VFTQPEVGIFVGSKPGERAADPYFDGKGPARSTCQLCGGCMVGCRYDAKNTLDKNYLFLAEQLGARVVPETRAVGIEPDGQGGYVVHARRALGWRRKPLRPLRARNVVVAAGTLGTVELLLACKAAGTLPGLSPALGRFVRTNSEIICGARGRNRAVDHSQGIAIASDLQTDAATHVQIVRYPAGSDVMALLGTLAVDGGGRVPRVLRWLGTCLRHPIDWLRNLWPFGFAKRSVVVLAMQSLDNALALVRPKRAWLGSRLRSRRAPGVPPIPTYLPLANQAARHVATRLGGYALNAINEVALSAPITAHILGGARMAETAAQGVVDGACRVFGHPGLWVVDGAAIPVNLGANPSLTILAVAEHAMSLIPAKQSG